MPTPPRTPRIFHPEAPSDTTDLTDFNTSPFAALPTAPGAQRIALLLPLKGGPHAESARTIRDGFMHGMALHSETTPWVEPSIQVYDTGTGQGENVPSAIQKAREDGADYIVGPLTKSEVQALSHMHTDIPQLVLNQIENTLPHSVYQFGLVPEDELPPITQRAYTQGHQRMIAIVINNAMGKRLFSTFEHEWTERGGQIIDTMWISGHETELSDQIRQLLRANRANKIHRTDFDAFFLILSPALARQVKPLLNFYYAERIPVYATSLIYTGTPSAIHDRDLDGIRFCDIPGVLTQHTRIETWPKSSRRAPRYFALGLDAYILAMQFPSGLSRDLDYSGMTGRLHLDREHHIQRSLVCAKFHNGLPVPE
jgi:hypothetical protein